MITVRTLSSEPALNRDALRASIIPEERVFLTGHLKKNGLTALLADQEQSFEHHLKWFLLEQNVLLWPISGTGSKSLKLPSFGYTSSKV